LDDAAHGRLGSLGSGLDDERPDDERLTGLR
jgi:hypothetical protein